MRILFRLFALFFGGNFIVASLVIASITLIPYVSDWYVMRDWQSIPATLHNVSGANNYTVANYSYEVGGVTYTGLRVYIPKFKDNIGSYHKKLQLQLHYAKTHQQPIAIWVNPLDLEQSVIDRSMRWELFSLMSAFTVIFFITGGATIIISFKKHSKKSTLLPLNAINQERPSDKNSSNQLALDKKEWKDNRIRSKAKSDIFGRWFIAITWNVVIYLIVFYVREQLNKISYLALTMPFLIIGLCLFWMAIKKSLEWHKYGVITLTLDPFPGSVDGQVGGRLDIKTEFQASNTFTVTLECVHKYLSGSQDSRSYKENIVWTEQCFANTNSSTKGTEVTFCFNTPGNLPETDVKRSASFHYWRLNVSADLPGLDLKRDYEIPVLKTDETSHHKSHNLSEPGALTAQAETELSPKQVTNVELDQEALTKKIRIRDLGNEIHFYYPMFRNRFLTCLAIMFSLIFYHSVDGIISIIVSLFCALASLYLPFASLSVCIADRHLLCTRRWLFFPIKKKTIDSNHITSIVVRFSGRVNMGAFKREYFDLIANTDDRKKIIIAESIDNKQLAEQLKNFIFHRLGVK